MKTLLLSFINLWVLCTPQIPLAGNDADNDGIPDYNTNVSPSPPIDNCLGLANPNQADYDKDGIGNVCDNCPFEANTGQEDANGDGIGDACQGFDYGPDSDGDGIPDGLDNCKFVSNPRQEDLDSNMAGNHCDSDIDGDGDTNNLDTNDNRPLGMSEGYDPPDIYDNCPIVFNYYGNYYSHSWGDIDDDNIGDYIYVPYYDFVEGCDNCWNVSNPDQLDSDGDGWGDACDNCPFVSNPDQKDDNSDGIGNACSPTASPTPPPSINPSPPPSQQPTLNPSSFPTTLSPTQHPTPQPTPDPSPGPTPGPSQSPNTANPTSPPTLSPSLTPSNVPTPTPTLSPTQTPTITPTLTPTIHPTISPTNTPSHSPILSPSISPTNIPSISPTFTPSISPSITPSISPSLTPTISPTVSPSISPTITPSYAPISPPSISPSIIPTNAPSNTPTLSPSLTPTNIPTNAPSNAPTLSPSYAPISPPSISPTNTPTLSPSFTPTITPSITPSLSPSIAPTNTLTPPPTSTPSLTPSNTPTISPSITPTISPSGTPTAPPTSIPTPSPTIPPSLAPTKSPSMHPTRRPTYNPTIEPTIQPTNQPTLYPTFIPTNIPTVNPTYNPTINPTYNPTINPTYIPTPNPIYKPTKSPSKNPTYNPTINPTYNPTINPTYIPTSNPIYDPTKSPSKNPTMHPTNIPSFSPTSKPTDTPTTDPTVYPTITPTINPTQKPSITPTKNPSSNPTITPTMDPTEIPTITPTQIPTNNPTFDPTSLPTKNPSLTPTKNPTVQPTQNPTVTPTKNPTISPSMNPTKLPSVNPTVFPSLQPSFDPTNMPSISPTDSTNNPTPSPSYNPTKSPTFNPSVTPTLQPSFNPTTTPSKYPTSYTYNPTTSPTKKPTVPPTNSPSSSPTDSPIADFRDFDSGFKIKYLVKYLEYVYIDLFVNNAFDIVNTMIEIIQQSYTEITGLHGEYFKLDIKDILGFKIKDINRDTEPHFLNSEREIFLNSKMYCLGKERCERLENSDEFRNNFELMVTEKLRKYFTHRVHNVNANAADDELVGSELEFEIVSQGALEMLYDSKELTLLEIMTQNPVLVILFCVLIIVFIISGFAWIHSKAARNDSIWYALIIYVFQFVVIVSDINLCVELWMHEAFGSDERIAICAVSSVIFIIIPYGINLYFAGKITRLIPKENDYAITFFKIGHGHDIFIGLLILCGDAYSALFILSSGIFGLKYLDSCLTKYELMQMNRIKIITTIGLLNIPQIIIQCVYFATVHMLTPNTAFAFVMSVLSIMCTPIHFHSYCRHSHSKNWKCYKYFIEISEKLNDNENNRQNERNKFISNQDRINDMKMILYEAFGYTERHENFIEISRNASIDKSGELLLYMVHFGDFNNINEIIQLYQDTERFLKSEFKIYFGLDGECKIVFKSMNDMYEITIDDEHNHKSHLDNTVKRMMDEKGLNYDSINDKQQFVNELYVSVTTNDDGEEEHKTGTKYLNRNMNDTNNEGHDNIELTSIKQKQDTQIFEHIVLNEEQQHIMQQIIDSDQYENSDAGSDSDIDFAV